jgi:hypothetical protein
MPPRNERRGRRRRKRHRESSHEEATVQAGFATVDYVPQSGVPRPGTNFNLPPPPATSPPSSSSGTGLMSGSATITSANHWVQPINVITSYPPPGKVPIPALRPPQSFESSVKDDKKGRTSHACDYCRKAKAGCTGRQPCTRCRNARVACVYSDRKREYDRK